MRPHLLEMEAFGPYAEPVTICFDTLCRDGLFLIHGSTGSGKTYLLDALCFALYGEVSGERSLKGLRSDHAPPQALPQVSLEFSAAGGRWRVERQAACEVPKSRGQGTTSKGAKAGLWRLLGGEPQPVAAGVQEVGREVARLVGLDAAQFRQVILLPQGRFAEVLRARDEDREALLKTLFDTSLYERAMGWLAGQAKAAEEELRERQRQQRHLLEQIAAAWEPWQREGQSSEKPPGEAPEEASPDLPSELLPEHLPTVQGAMEALQQQAALHLDRAEARFLQAQAGLAELRSRAELWDRRQRAQARLQELAQQQEPMVALQARLALAERAETVRASMLSEADARQRREEAETRCRQRLERLRRQRDAADQAPDAVMALGLLELPEPARLTTALNALAVRQGELEQVLALAERRRGARREEERARQELQEANGRIARGQELLAQEQSRLDGLQQPLLQARSARDGLTGLELAARQAARISTALQQQEEAVRQLQQATAAVLAAEAAQHQARTHQLDLRERQLQGMAARLAADLQEGEPCPVCGSRQHPQPAPVAADAVADAALAAAEHQLEETGRALVAARATQAGLQAQLEALADQLPEGPLPSLQAAQAEAARAVAELEGARRLAGALDGLEAERQQAEHRVQQFQQRLRQREEETIGCRQVLAEKQKGLADLNQRITAGLGGDHDPATLLLQIQGLMQALETLIEAAQQRALALSLETEAQRRLAGDLARAGFNDPQALVQALAPEAERLAWSRTLQQHAADRALAQGVLAELAGQELPELRPDLQAAETGLASADAARRDALARFTRAETAVTAITGLIQRHGTGAAELAEQQRQADLVQGVAARCLGQSDPHISLQRWVLSAYLEEICGYANHRLSQMTAGRYELRLSDASGQRRGSKAGLGLRVLDAYTGEEREVSSLSGGETFQASLALALGVADTVQAHSGGVVLEALFIDEGFGSLDPDSLHLAMDELDRLREGGRMIGLISHVAALRERIRTGLEVVASERGSRVVVGTLEAT
ncbi:SMC domain protein [Cyanobium sp. PCC 7001]|uniref:AAA family ATPase n=1 Tax=Cyanobium sp. PCC 7001 TaxID=180281 RepID=UPI00018052A7|nr:SMC family ATPase [Cyanobium sp. PCC 7001]EDY38242.1 SMC domain protein [Cyanobium sp. PCC 7001]